MIEIVTIKPRLRRRRGIWVCTASLAELRPMGHGYTPWEAYADWRAQALPLEQQ